MAEFELGRALADRLLDPDRCPSPREARDYLNRIARVSTVVPGDELQHQIAALARFAAGPNLLRKLTGLLPAIEDLGSVADQHAGQPTLAVLDLELDPSGLPTDVAVVLMRGDERVGARRWDGVDPNLDDWLDDAVVCAHNGEEHDFPILHRHGMSPDHPRLDTLRWFWLAAPLNESHSLRDLVAHSGADPTDRLWHSALGDAEALASALPGLRRSLQAMPEDTRSALRVALDGTVDLFVLDWLVGLTAESERWQRRPLVKPLPTFAATGATRSVETQRDLSAWRPTTLGVVVDAERHRCIARGGGWYLRGKRTIDAGALCEALPGGGWSAAIAVRVVDEADGALPAWPPSALSMLYPNDADEGADPTVPVRPEPTLAVGPGPWNCEPDTAASVPGHTPMTLVDAVHLLFGASTSLSDVSTHRGPVSALVTHAGPRGRQASGPLARIWAQCLGSAPTFIGGSDPLDVEAVIVTGLARHTSVRRHLARVASVAAGLTASSSVLLVTNGDRRDMAANAMRGSWRALTGTYLLRPSAWPTLREASARMSQEHHLAVMTPGRAPRLKGSWPVVIDRIGAPPPEQPTVARLLDTLGDGDPYGDVIEPIAALRLLRVLASASGSAYIVDPVADSPLVRSCLATGSGWRSVSVATLEGSPRSVAARQALLEGDQAEGERPRASATDLVDAAQRLVPDGAGLHEFQQTVTSALIEGHDVLGVFRTGAGKSLCYQATALAFSAAGQGCTVVLSPLIALQRDQVTALREREVWTATSLNSEIEYSVRAARLRGIGAGYYQLVYIAPEALFSAGVVDTLARAGVTLVAVDEAHCITEIGHNFRPDYRSIPTALRRLAALADDEEFTDAPERAQLIALTGTANPEVQEDIQGQLQGRFRVFVDSQFIRPELHFEVVRIPDEPGFASGPGIDGRPLRWQALLETLQGCRLPGIIYTRSRRNTEELAEGLRANGYPSTLAYHARLAADDRASVEHAFRSGEAQLIVATSAFGMGIDKDDICTVIHWRMPQSPEALYQEAGRAGRGPAGQPGRCVVLYHPSDLVAAGRLVRTGVPTREELERVWATLGEMADLQDPADGSRVTVADTDLATMSALPDGMDPHICIAHLERVGLVKETERTTAAVIVRTTGERSDADLPPVETEVLHQAATSDGRVTMRAVVDALAGRGVNVTIAEVATALRALQRSGQVDVSPSLVRLRPATDDPVRTLARRCARAVQFLGSLPSAPDGFLRPEVTPPLPHRAIAMCLETLAGLGAIDVRHQRRDDLPTARQRPAGAADARRILSCAPAVLARAIDERDPSTGDVNLERVAALEHLEVQAVRQALTAAHLLQAVLLDPHSWQSGLDQPGSRAGRPTTARVLALNRDDPEAGLDRAEARSVALAHTDLLRLEALRVYGGSLTKQVQHTEDAGDPCQTYLQDYFMRPGFLDDLAAGMAKDILKHLDADQATAVTDQATRLTIRAGAGSGKTRTLTRRIAHRVTTGSILPEQVLAVCFTKSAVDEMSTRIAELGVAGVRVSTLNSVGNRIVRSHWPNLGFHAEPVLLDERRREGERMIQSLIATHSPEVAASAWVKRVAAQLDRARTNLIPPEFYPDNLRPLRSARGGAAPTDEQIARIYADYMGGVRNAGRLDFVGQIELAVEVLADVDDVRRPVLGNLREVFVDEAQDLTALDWRLVELLAADGRLTAVGDPRQAIYEWRGASPAMFDAFGESSQLRDLRSNYRSAPQIVVAANELMVQYPSLISAVDHPGESSSVSTTTQHTWP